jgi:hypothetical protein
MCSEQETWSPGTAEPERILLGRMRLSTGSTAAATAVLVAVLVLVLVNAGTVE